MVKMVNTIALKSVLMGYRFKSYSEHTCLVKIVDTLVSKSIPMGYQFESDSKYLNV
jgi:hypothetical protein